MDFYLGDNIVFVYPDMETVLVGLFRDGKLIAGKPSKIIGERCHNGIKEIKVARPKYNSPVVKYDHPNRIRIGDQPTVMDPLERQNIFIQDGKKDDGVFARKNMSKGDFIMYYSGTIWNAIELPLRRSNQTSEER